MYVKAQHKPGIPIENICLHIYGADRDLLLRWLSLGPYVRLLCTGLEKGDWCRDPLWADPGEVFYPASRKTLSFSLVKLFPEAQRAGE